MKYVYIAFVSVFITGCVQLNAATPQVGDTIAEFALPALMPDGSVDTVKLSDFDGQWKVLFFYPKDFTVVCPTELNGLTAIKAKFEELKAVVLPISMDTPESHKKWAAEVLDPGFNFIWLSDTDGRLTKYFNIADKTNEGRSLRGTYLIDPNGVLVASEVYNEKLGRSTDELTRVIAAAQTGVKCPLNWQEGDEPLEEKKQ